MSDWSSGYVVDIEYDFGYYREMNPLSMRLPLLQAGVAPPNVATACELGFGQGVSTVIHAAASNVEWTGTDFHPAQASLAQEMARHGAPNARLYDEAFKEFCSRTDLPDFDFIGLHGIWCWVTDENRKIIVDFLRRKLKVGGVAYVSYNVFPGWGSFAPLRHLIQQHAECMSPPGEGMKGKVTAALDFVDTLAAANPAFFRANPFTTGRLKKLRTMSPTYVAHEYFAQDWHTMHIGTVRDWLNEAKLSYVCSARPKDQIEALHLTAEQQAFMGEVSDPIFKESIRDFMMNQDFRRDYWVKGPRLLKPLEQTEALRAERVVLLTSPADVNLKVEGVLGEAQMNEKIYRPVIDALGDHKARTLGEVERLVAPAGVNLSQLLQAMLVLSAQHSAGSAHSDDVASRAKANSGKLNAYLARRGRNNGDFNAIASPVSGGGIGIQRFSLMALHFYLQGSRQADDLAAKSWQMLQAQGQKVVREGKAIDTEAESLAQLTAHARTFIERELPILKALQAV